MIRKDGDSREEDCVYKWKKHVEKRQENGVVSAKRTVFARHWLTLWGKQAQTSSFVDGFPFALHTEGSLRSG